MCSFSKGRTAVFVYSNFGKVNLFSPAMLLVSIVHSTVPYICLLENIFDFPAHFPVDLFMVFRGKTFAIYMFV